MKTELQASVVLAVLVGLLSVVVEVSGLNRNFLASQLVFLAGAIAINVAVVFWALSRHCAESDYGRQLARSAAIGVVGGALVVVVSWLLLAVVFPGSIDTMRQAAIDYMSASGMPQDEVDRQMEAIGRATPLSQSLPGGVGTLVTSVVAGAVIALFQRRKA